MMQSEDDGLPFGTSADFAHSPAARVKQLASYGEDVDIDPNVPIKRYYRSGLEMVRMADVYLQEGSLENAYILHIKFMTLFIEKIRKHPEYATLAADVKSANQASLKEILPKAEKLKAKLIDRFTKQHKKYLREQKAKQIQTEELARQKKERVEQEKQDERLAERLQAQEDQKMRANPNETNGDTTQWHKHKADRNDLLSLNLPEVKSMHVLTPLIASILAAEKLQFV